MNKKIQEGPDILGIKDVSRIFGVSYMTIRRWDKLGLLPSFRLGETQHRKYQKKDIINLINKQNMQDTTREIIEEGADELKFHGIHFTPEILGKFVARKMVESYSFNNETISIADPAIGDGSLLIPLHKELDKKNITSINSTGFDIVKKNVDDSIVNLRQNHIIGSSIYEKDFISFVLNDENNEELFDMVISNPPYVRTQVLGAEYSKMLSKAFGFTGRIDLYYAFIDGIHKILKTGGITGIIVSNKFMKNRAGYELRKRIIERYDIISIWDFGDTKLFEAAVLPCVLILRKKGKEKTNIETTYTSIYTLSKPAKDISLIQNADNVIEAIDGEGDFFINNQYYHIQKGILGYNSIGDNWELSNAQNDDFINKIQSRTWKYFGDVGKIKVGVKTTADNVFINTSWSKELMNSGLIHNLTTHHTGNQFRATGKSQYSILYPYEMTEGKRKVVNLDLYPEVKSYLNGHYDQLDGRSYIKKSNREWYEIWVPHSPNKWIKPKIIFRDICKEPTFWMDLEGTIVNGDCYWIQLEKENDDILWLMLAIGNSKFIEDYYDHKFNNKIYAGRRRFMSQYVEKFPLLDPTLSTTKEIVEISKKIYSNSSDFEDMKKSLDRKIYSAFGLN